MFLMSEVPLYQGRAEYRAEWAEQGPIKERLWAVNFLKAELLKLLYQSAFRAALRGLKVIENP